MSNVRKSYTRMGMEHDEFVHASNQLAQYIRDYYKTLSSRKTLPDVKLGFMNDLVPSEAPFEPEAWEKVREDLENVVMKGMVHWQSPGFLAYFPSSTSYPAILAESLSAAVACLGFSWACSPSCTELEILTMNWLAKAIGLPDEFMHTKHGLGGGVVQSSASEGTLMSLLASREKVIKKLLKEDQFQSEFDVLPKLVAYFSEISHCGVERACRIAMVRHRKLPVNKIGSVEVATLQSYIDEDKDKGFIPIFVCATLGTTGCCSYDDLLGFGNLCNREEIWLHVDAAYAGCAFICPEFRKYMEGIQFADSIVLCLSKWLMINVDFSTLWVRNSSYIVNSLNMQPVYLEHERNENAVEFRHWTLPVGRRFRALKLWFVMRLIGINGLRSRVRRDVLLAKMLKKTIRKDKRFEIVFPVTLGLICIRLKRRKDDIKENRRINESLLKTLTKDGRVYITPSQVNGIYFLRLSVGSTGCTEESIMNNWKIIQEAASDLLSYK